MVTIRRFQSGDEQALRDLFYNTIRTVNLQDYSEQQVKAWAPDEYDQAVWSEKISALDPFVALIDDVIVGYADVQTDGYIDHFFCHSDYQGQGIGKKLMQSIHEQAKAKALHRLYAHASITARPFFEHFGFSMVKQQQVEIRGQKLTNFIVEKSLTSKV